MVLKYVENRKHEEIADLLDLSTPHASEVLVSKAKKRLRSSKELAAWLRRNGYKTWLSDDDVIEHIDN